MDDLRKVCILRPTGEFVEGEMKDLKKGDIFQLYEPDGTIVVNKAGDFAFISGNDSYLKDGIWTVEATGVKISKTTKYPDDDSLIHLIDGLKYDLKCLPRPWTPLRRSLNAALDKVIKGHGLDWDQHAFARKPE
jgi:hypothetical protein